MIMSLRSNQRLLHTRQNLFCLRQRQPQIGDLGKAGGSIDLYQVDTICRDVGARFDQSQNPTHARSPGQKDKDKDRRIAPGPIPPISGQSRHEDEHIVIAPEYNPSWPLCIASNPREAASAMGKCAEMAHLSKEAWRRHRIPNMNPFMHSRKRTPWLFNSKHGFRAKLKKEKKKQTKAMLEREKKEKATNKL